MRDIFAFVFALSFTVTVTVRAADPAVAVDQARAHIAAKRFSEALTALNGALEAAEQLPGKERVQATAAIHFYSAVALASTGAAADARAHLEQFFRLMPNAKLTGGDRYDPRFAKLFNEIAPNHDLSTRFETYYAGFNSFSAEVSRDDASGSWGDSPALDLLGSKREKREWQTLLSLADRTRFIEDFWRRRDPTPQTPENEFRDTFERRVAFADRVFASSASRGSVTDRGKVFVLLGEPSSVLRRPITNRDAIRVMENEIINGTIELWTYTRERLPITIAKKGVIFRFVTQKGIGDNVLQREDVYGFQALAVAMNPNERQ
jgi:GWxTD domain-containing protein